VKDQRIDENAELNRRKQREQRSCLNRAVIMKKSSKKPVAKGFATSVEPTLKRAARVARKTAKMYGTKLYFWKNGKVVAEDP
jgi:hypothetical protein